MNYNVISSANQWDQALTQLRSGAGLYYVAPPDSTMSLSAMKINLNNIKLFIADIEAKFDYIVKAIYTNPMHAIVTLLQQRAYAYDVAIAEKQNLPVPDSSTVDNSQIAPADTAEVKKSNTPVILLGAGLLGLFLYSKYRNKKKVAGIDSLLPVAVIGAGLLFLSRMKKNTPVVTYDAGPSNAGATPGQSQYVR